MPDRLVTKIPADVDRPDAIMFGLTARQAVIVAVTLALAGGLAWLTARLTPLPAAVVIGLVVPVVAAGVGVAVGQRDGLSLDRYLWAALRQARAPRRMVAAPEGIPAPPAWLSATVTQQPAAPAPLELPARTLTSEGVLDLGDDGAAMVCRATPVNLSLRTPAEQAALVESFGRFLHQLGGPVQVLVRSHPVDLAPVITRLATDAAVLPHPALEAAAHQHAAFLTSLARRRDLLCRDLLVVFRDPTPHAASSGRAAGLRRRAEEGTSLLAVAGVTLTPLEPSAVDRALTTSPPRAGGAR